MNDPMENVFWCNKQNLFPTTPQFHMTKKNNKKIQTSMSLLVREQFSASVHSFVFNKLPKLKLSMPNEKIYSDSTSSHMCVNMLYAALSLLIFNFLMHARNMNIKHSFYSEIFILRIYNSSCTECILQINIFSNSKMWKLKINSLNSCFFLSSYTFQFF